MLKTPKAVLFDLDGTLIDTAPDMSASLNRLLEQKGQATLSMEHIRPVISQGAKALVKLAFPKASATQIDVLQNDFLGDYAEHFAVNSHLFEGMGTVLNALEKRKISWGIVTNKPSKFAAPLLTALGLDTRCKVLVCGDTLPVNKPDPIPLIYAQNTLSLHASECIYIGDAETDIIAAKAANMSSIAAAYGYISHPEVAETWGAEYVAASPMEIISCLTLS